MKAFFNRHEAGEELGMALNAYKNEDAVIVAIPRGGLPVGAAVSDILQKPLDVVLSKKIGHPYNKEYAVGAVSMENRILGDVFDISQRYIEEETSRIRKLLAYRYDQYYKKCQPIDLENKTVIVIDDGVATGNTLIVTIELITQKKPAKIVVAIPVASMSALNKIKRHKNVSEVICLKTPESFHAVGEFYQDFSSVTDAQAIEILEQNRKKYPK